jgi:putative Holliday junction resolvase
MGLDIGDKRIGIAISDALNLTAQSKDVIIRTNHRQDLKIIKKYIAQYQVDQLIVGLPKNMDGSLGKQAQKTQAYVNFLKNNLEIPIEFWDERLSTREAEKLLIEANVRRSRRKGVIDQVAASIILQGYLDNFNRNTGGDKNG